MVGPGADWQFNFYRDVKSSFEMDVCGVTPSYGLNIYETDEAQDTSVSSMIIFAAVQVDRVMNQISRLWKFTIRWNQDETSFAG